MLENTGSVFCVNFKGEKKQIFTSFFSFMNQILFLH